MKKEDLVGMIALASLIVIIFYPYKTNIWATALFIFIVQGIWIWKNAK